MTLQKKRVEKLEKTKSEKNTRIFVSLDGIYTIDGEKLTQAEFEAKYGVNHDVIKVDGILARMEEISKHPEENIQADAHLRELME